MADYGIEAGEYAPDVITYTGQIGKIARQVIEGEGVVSEFGSLFGEDFTTGKDLEVAVYKAATGVDYSGTEAPAAPYPSSEVLLFKSAKKRTYPVRIDNNQIDESSIDAQAANKNAQEVVKTLYTGAFKDENGYVLSIFKDADPDDDEIIDGGTFVEIDDETKAKALLKEIKTFAKYIRRGSSEVNPKGLEVKAPRVCMLIPANVETELDVYARLSAENLDYTRYGIDEVFEYIPDAGENAEIYIFDARFAQIHRVHKDSYKEQPEAGCDNVKAYLHRYVQYAGCPLFSCVKLAEGATPPPIEHYLESDATYTFTAYDAEDPTTLDDSVGNKTARFPFTCSDGSYGIMMITAGNEYGATVAAYDPVEGSFYIHNGATGLWLSEGKFTTGTITDEIIAALPEGFEAWLEANTTKTKDA